MTAYRYTLDRGPLGDLFDIPGGTEKRVLFVMLNPSTADERVDDPTIRRCVGFARQWGFRHLRVVNLFAARSTDPDALRDMEDPVGPQNDEVLARELARADRVVAAWGVHGSLHGRDRVVLELGARGDWWCLGVTKHGYPRHPLYVRADQPLLLLREAGR